MVCDPSISTTAATSNLTHEIQIAHGEVNAWGCDNVTTIDSEVLIEAATTQIISDELLGHLNFYLNALLCGLVALFGTGSNVINLLIFQRLRLKDSMSVCLFALSFSDFLLSLLILASRAFPVWDLFFPSNSTDPNAVDYVIFNWPIDPLFIISGWITALLALERCVCVTIPFKVKQMFTRNRAIMAVALIYAVAIATYVPIFATQRLEWRTSVDDDELSKLNDNYHNVTTSLRPPIQHHLPHLQSQQQHSQQQQSRQRRRLVPAYSGNRQEVEFYVEIIGISVLPVPSLVVTLVAVICMTYSLGVSVRTREALTAGSALTVTCSTGRDGDRDRDPNPCHNSVQESKMSLKSRRLVKVVLSLAVIFTLCSVPRFYAALLSIYRPEVNEFGSQRNLSVFNWHFARFATAVNASVNIFVYLRINSSYRIQFKKLCQCVL